MSELKSKLIKEFGENNIIDAYDELTIIVKAEDIIKSCLQLKDDFDFDTLIDLCSVDYLDYGKSDWNANASQSGFSRARENQINTKYDGKRFAVVYHLLSVVKNNRVRVKTYLSEDNPIIESVTNIWPVADWYEREVFDLMGILFENHTDLRRILTDYGFTGHPLRKDFPLIGEVEMLYDDTLGRIIYQPVSIEPNVNVPRVIRNKDG
jgi:NADH-quinone oxidoreductase subunit C